MNNKLKYPNSLLYLSTYIGFPLLALILFIPWSVELDRLVTDYFYTHTHFRSSDFSSFLYRFGFYPAWVLAMMSFVILLLSFKFISLKKWRRGAIFLIAALAVGPGLFVHLVLKDHWGRPRPKQVIEYGGNQPFRPFYEPNFFQQSEPSKSFPCGHCSTGFYFFALAAVGRYYRKSSLYWLGLGLAIILGSLLSYARIAQGGHFLSDTLLSAFIIWLTTWGLYKLIFKNKSD